MSIVAKRSPISATSEHLSNYLTNALESIVGLLNMNFHLVDAVVDHTHVGPLRQSRHLSSVSVDHILCPAFLQQHNLSITRIHTALIIRLTKH